MFRSGRGKFIDSADAVFRFDELVSSHEVDFMVQDYSADVGTKTTWRYTCCTCKFERVAPSKIPSSTCMRLFLKLITRPKLCSVI